RVEGDTWTWERRDLPPLLPEPGSPNWATLAPRLGVTWGPPAGARGPAPFRSWTDVGRWIAALADPQAEPDDAVRARTRELGAGAASDDQRLGRLARFVQGLPYDEIAIYLDRGRGLQPRPASQVLRSGYGDCKDKANLLRTMLRVAGVRSWLVMLNSSARGLSSPRWPSPFFFDH